MISGNRIKRTILVTMSFLWITFPGFAQQPTGTLQGVVLDQGSKTPLKDVNITIKGTRYGTTSDEQGEFRIGQLPPGEYQVVFSFLGYAKQEKSGVSIVSGQTLALGTIQLKQQAIPLSEVVVSPGSYSLMGNHAAVRQTLSSEDIKIMGWAEDVTRAVQRIPGISADEFSAKFSVRGGDADEVLVLLDGMQIYKPFHQKDFGGGLFSTIDIETIDGVELLTGGFSADYGDRMSGVLSMTTKSPAAGQKTTSLGLSLMNARFFSMGDINQSRGSWLVSGRRGYLDILDKLTKNEFKLKPTYYDMLSKVEYNLNDRHNIAAYGFFARDSYKLNERIVEPGKTIPNIDSVDTKYGNYYGWVTLNSRFADGVKARTIVFGSALDQQRRWRQFDDDPNAHLNSTNINDQRDFTLFGIKQDWNIDLSSKVLLKAGADIKRLKVDYDYFNRIENEFITADDSLVDQIQSHSYRGTREGNQSGLYLSLRTKLADPLTMETGIRYDDAGHSNDQLWSPRVGLAYALGNTTFLRAGWGHFYQIQAINDLDVQFAEDTFQPAQLAEHYMLGFEHLFGNGFHFRAEGYYKKRSDLRDAYHTFSDIDEFFPESRDDLIKLVVDQGTARGLEFYLKYDKNRKFSTWFSYVLADTRDDITDIVFEGRLVKQFGEQPRPWDQRHTINMDANYRFNKSWHLNMSWQFRTGWPGTEFTVQRIERPDGSFAYYHDYGLYNGFRYPNYQRLDARINKHFYPARSKVSVFLHIINLYNHENVIKYDHEVLESNADGFHAVLEPETWFGIIPFIGVSWEM